MSKPQIGVVGMAVMGKNLALNIESRGYSVAIYNRTGSKTEKVVADHPDKNLVPSYTIEDFVNSLETPRRIILMVKAGAPTDATIKSLLPHLDKGDVLIDGGNTFFQETMRRNEELDNSGINFIGMGVSDPEKKRKIIGNEFIRVFDDEAAKLEGIEFLAQGTLYTDIIESGTDTAQTIKSHHNVGGLPEDVQFKLIEPLNTLFKDEVRELGEKLGMPHELVWRQPFPGPGLGIRVIGEITEEKLEIVRDSDLILREEIAKHGLDKEIWQYFTVLPGIRSVGVMGDGRTYDYTVGIRAVTSIDGMTADFAQIPWDVLQEISVRIVNEVDYVNRVVYDITSKPPATIEWE